MTPDKLQLVIFDCDGVLVDSEAVSAQVCAEEITRLGWPITPSESMARFIGLRLADMVPVVEAQLGRPVPGGWIEQVRTHMIAAFANVQAVPGAADVLRATAALGLPYRVASNSAHEEMVAKFDRTGLAGLIGGRKHSARDVARGKPAPDVFLAAAAAEGVPPSACLVVEDSLPGIAAALAAGMVAVGLDMHGDGAALRAAGAYPIRELAELPALLAAAQRQGA